MALAANIVSKDAGAEEWPEIEKPERTAARSGDVPIEFPPATGPSLACLHSIADIPLIFGRGLGRRACQSQISLVTGLASHRPR
jgi:hypothetical protein